MVKEALHNIARHAQASEVEVNVSLLPRSLKFCIRDNGIGFIENGEHPAAGGNGLENMRRRIAALGSILEIHSQPGHGTQIQFEVALKPL